MPLLLQWFIILCVLCSSKELQAQSDTLKLDRIGVELLIPEGWEIKRIDDNFVFVKRP